MRRKNLGNRIVKKAITWAMIVMMSFSGAMSGFASMTVYAEGTTDNVIDNYVDDGWLDLHTDLGSQDEEYHNNEAEKVAEGSESVRDMNEQVTIAEQAAKDAADEVANLESEIGKANTAKSNAETAATNANPAATNAENAAKSAQDAVDALPSDTASKIDSYNDQVNKDQDTINNINVQEVKNEGGQIIVGTVTAEDGTTKDVTLKDYVNTQVGEAKAAAEEAKTKLEEALAIETDEVTDEVRDKVKEVKEAAEKAEDAYKKADDACTKAEKQKDAAIKEYNLYAMAYGLPRYEETEITYSEEEAKAAVEKANLQGEIDTINAATLEEQKGKIEAAEKAAGDAKTAVEAAKGAADTAKENAEKAEKAISDLDAEADEAANKVNNYYVDPAEDALKTTNDNISNKEKEINGTDDQKGLQAIYDDAVRTAQLDGEGAYQEELNRLLSAMNSAKKDYDTARGLARISCWIAYENAKNDYERYNTEETKSNVINDTVANSKEVQTASQNLTTAQNELAALEEQKTKEKAALNAAIETRNNYLSEASKAYEDEAKEKFISDINDILRKYSDEINQIDYDQALNSWANDVHFLDPDTIDKGIARDIIDDKYDDYLEGWESFLNTLVISQWLVKPETEEAAMNEIRQAYKACIEDYYEKMATAEANWAAMDTEAAKEAAEETMKEFAPIITSIETAQKAVGDADGRIQTARNTYNEAAEDLKELKDSVKDCKFDSLSLELLESKIVEAEAAVEAAKEALEEAETAKAVAQNYADWANALVSKHYTRSYAQALVDENGDPILDEEGNKQFSFVNGKEFDITDKGVVSRDPKWFLEVSEGKQSKQVVPYSIYRAYVKAMYESYNYSMLSVNEKNEGKGLGISTGTITETGEQIDGTMKVIYWEVDENNKLTGNQIPTDKLVDGQTYFVGYTFKHEGDGYHIDGVLFTYEAPVVEPTPGPTETPEPTTPSPTPTTPSPAPTTTPGGTTPTDTPVIIPDAPVALAAAPVAADNGAAVLGARRTDGDAAEAAVLGARRGTEQAVLGKRRKPQTGDNAALNAWMAAMTMAAGAAGISGTKLAKGKKKEEKED